MMPWDNERQEMEDEFGAALGDPRHCRRHPSQVISSPDGMFDTTCGMCEMEADSCEEEEKEGPHFQATVDKATEFFF